MWRKLIVCTTILGLFSFASTAQADWHWPWQSQAPQSFARPSAAQLANSQTSAKTPSIWAKVTGSTKNMITSTKNVMLPGKKSPSTTSVSAAKIADKHPTDKWTGFSSHHEANPTKTIKDFVSAPRVKP